MTEAEIAGQATPPEASKPARPRRRSTTKPRASRATAVKKDEVEAATPKKRHVHQVHFLEDGVTALDRVFVRGEQIEVTEGSPWWEMLHNRDGDCLFALDRHEQMVKFGKQLWEEGPWPYEPYDLQAKLDNGESLTAEEQQVLKKANADRIKQQPLGAGRSTR
jgi:hypothetical protein